MNAQQPVIDPITQPQECWCAVQVLRVIDADTLVANVHLPWSVVLVDQTLRVDSYDAWETSKRRQSEAAGEITDDEVVKGRIAKSEFEKLLPTGTLYAKPGLIPRDNYGRLLGPWEFRTGFKVESMQSIAKRKGWIRKKAGE